MHNHKALRIALIGYGRMGKLIEQIALERGHTIALIVDEHSSPEVFSSEALRSCDVAIEFTRPEAAEHNCQHLIQAGVAVVSGTTGWAEGVSRLSNMVQQGQGGSFFWASNFSLGVNLFFEAARRLSSLMHSYSTYTPKIQEVHHIHKLDAPSGTAITLAERVLSEQSALVGWHLQSDEAQSAPDSLPIHAIREGEVAGIHSISYRSAEDVISLRHEAFSRRGFALGAVLAAEYAAQHSGVHTMQDLIAKL